MARWVRQTSRMTAIPLTGMRPSQTGCVCEWHLKTTNLKPLGFSAVLLGAGGWSVQVVTGQEQLSLWTLFVCHPAEVWDDPLLVSSVSVRVSTLLEIEDTTCCCKLTSPVIQKSLTYAWVCSSQGITALPVETLTPSHHGS